MTDWSWAREAYDEHFGPVAALGYELERVDVKTYWDLHEEHLRAHFPPEVFFDLRSLRTEAQKRGQERIAASARDGRLQDFCVARSNGLPMVFFCGEQRTESVYRMWHTNVHPDHRRRGVYRTILECTIAYTDALGFDTITSEHAPGNNGVLIAKLKAGFRVVSMDIDPMVGVSVVLKYFHNAEHLAAFELRTGLATLSPALRESGFGAMSLLRAQFSGE